MQTTTRPTCCELGGLTDESDSGAPYGSATWVPEDPEPSDGSPPGSPTEAGSLPPPQLLSDLLELNGGRPVSPGVAQLVWLLTDQLVDAEEQLEAITGALSPHGYLEGKDLRTTVSHAVAKIEQLQQEHQDLSEMALKYVDVGERYYRERQYRVNVAAVAARVILRSHAGSHTGAVTACETCAADWAVVEEASGVRAPGN